MRRVRAAGNVRHAVSPSRSEVVTLMGADLMLDSEPTEVRKLRAYPERDSLVRTGERPRVGRSTKLRDQGKLGHGVGGKTRARQKRWETLSAQVAGLSDPGCKLPGSATVDENWRIGPPALTRGSVSKHTNPDYAESLFVLVTQTGESFYVHRETGETYPLDDESVDW